MISGRWSFLSVCLQRSHISCTCGKSQMIPMQLPHGALHMWWYCWSHVLDSFSGNDDALFCDNTMRCDLTCEPESHGWFFFNSLWLLLTSFSCQWVCVSYPGFAWRLYGTQRDLVIHLLVYMILIVLCLWQLSFTYQKVDGSSAHPVHVQVSLGQTVNSKLLLMVRLAPCRVACC